MVRLAAFLLLSGGTAALAAGGERVPRIGLAGGDLDACLSVARVTGLNPRGDNFLAVRAEPNSSAPEKDRLGPGREVWLCDEVGEWRGIVYGRELPEGVDDCGVGTPAASPRAYAGPCKWGWVHSRYLVVIAG